MLFQAHGHWEEEFPVTLPEPWTPLFPQTRSLLPFALTEELPDSENGAGDQTSRPESRHRDEFNFLMTAPSYRREA